MTPEVQHYLLAGFLLLAAVFAVPLLKRILKPVKKRISDRISVAPGETSLEDVFIQFMAGSRDNMS